MRHILFFIAFLSFAALAENPTRYRHVQDSDGKVLATYDSKEGSVQFFGSKDEVVKILIGQLDGVIAECNRRLTPAAPSAPEPKAAKKKNSPPNTKTSGE